MRLYPKKLHNIEDLEREKKLLAKQVKALDTEELFSLEGIMDGLKSSGKKSKNKEEENEGMLGSLLGMLPVSNPLISMGIKLVQGRLNRPSVKPKKKAEQSYLQEEKPRKNIIKKVAFEVLTGYLKWKAIELTYKGVKHIIRSRKEKRESNQSSHS